MIHETPRKQKTEQYESHPFQMRALKENNVGIPVDDNGVSI